MEVHLLAHAINAALGAIGNTVDVDSGDSQNDQASSLILRRI